MDVYALYVSLIVQIIGWRLSRNDEVSRSVIDYLWLGTAFTIWIVLLINVLHTKLRSVAFWVGMVCFIAGIGLSLYQLCQVILGHIQDSFWREAGLIFGGMFICSFYRGDARRIYKYIEREIKDLYQPSIQGELERILHFHKDLNTILQNMRQITQQLLKDVHPGGPSVIDAQVNPPENIPTIPANPVAVDPIVIDIPSNPSGEQLEHLMQFHEQLATVLQNMNEITQQLLKNMSTATEPPTVPAANIDATTTVSNPLLADGDITTTDPATTASNPLESDRDATVNPVVTAAVADPEATVSNQPYHDTTVPAANTDATTTVSNPPLGDQDITITDPATTASNPLETNLDATVTPVATAAVADPEATVSNQPDRDPTVTDPAASNPLETDRDATVTQVATAAVADPEATVSNKPDHDAIVPAANTDATGNMSNPLLVDRDVTVTDPETDPATTASNPLETDRDAIVNPVATAAVTDPEPEAIVFNQPDRDATVPAAHTDATATVSNPLLADQDVTVTDPATTASNPLETDRDATVTPIATAAVADPEPEATDPPAAAAHPGGSTVPNRVTLPDLL